MGERDILKLKPIGIIPYGQNPRGYQATREKVLRYNKLKWKIKGEIMSGKNILCEKRNNAAIINLTDQRKRTPFPWN